MICSCFMADGTSRRVSHFDRLKVDGGYSRAFDAISTRKRGHLPFRFCALSDVTTSASVDGGNALSGRNRRTTKR